MEVIAVKVRSLQCARHAIDSANSAELSVVCHSVRNVPCKHHAESNAESTLADRWQRSSICIERFIQRFS